MRSEHLKIVGLVAVILLCGWSLTRKRTPPRSATDNHRYIGGIAAEEFAIRLGDREGRYLIVEYEGEDRRVMRAEIDAFLKGMRAVGGWELAGREAIDPTRGGTEFSEGPAGVPTDLFTGAIRKHEGVDLVVSFVGVPNLLIPQARKDTESWPPLVLLNVQTRDARRLVDAGKAVFAVAYLPEGRLSDTPAKDTADWFGRFYQVLPAAP